MWLKRVLLPARVPGAEIPNVNELQEMRGMLAERVKIWTDEWKQQGIQQGETKLLRRQLVRRFGSLPSWVDQRMQEASMVELECWADRVLDCPTLDEVFRA